jgi:hypothetical protein
MQAASVAGCCSLRPHEAYDIWPLARGFITFLMTLNRNKAAPLPAVLFCYQISMVGEAGNQTLPRLRRDQRH